MTEDQANRVNQAADWFVRISAEDLSEVDLAEWLRWCSDPLNAAEFSRIQVTWAGVDQLRPDAMRLLEALTGAAQPSAGVATVTPRREARHGRFPRIAKIMAAAACSGVVVAGLWYARGTDWLWPSHRTVATAVTNQSTELPDGSTLTLAPRTHVAVDFSGATRSLALSHGEAYFKVRPNHAKPFVVHTGDLTVTAVGTAFDVRSVPDRTVVTVQEGIVSVSSIAHDKPANGDWRVGAGYQVVYDSRIHEVRLSAVDPKHALGWREGRLEYIDEPLDAVVTDVNRYSLRPIKVRDAEIGQLMFTGTVFIDSIDEWLTGIQSTFPLRALITTDNQILLVSSKTDLGSIRTTP